MPAGSAVRRLSVAGGSTLGGLIRNYVSVHRRSQTYDGLPHRSSYRLSPTGITLALGELQVWSLVLVGVAYWGNVVRTYPHEGAISLAAIARSIVADGAFNFAAWAMIAGVAGTIAPRGVASSRQIALTTAIALMCVVPTRQATIAALLTLGLILALPAGTRQGRQVAILLFGLAAEMVWK